MVCRRKGKGNCDGEGEEPMQAIRTHLVVIHGMILVEMKACGWYYSPQTLLRGEQIDGDDLTAPRRTGSQISGARISSASKKPSILSGTTSELR